MRDKYIIKLKKVIGNYCFLAFVCFLISPIISIFLNCYLIYKSQTFKQKYLISAIIALSFGYLGYHTIPIESQDLFRHYKIINILSNVPIADVLKYSYPGVYLNTYIMYFCAILKNPSLYSLIYLSIGFYIIFFLALKFGAKYKISFSNMILVLLFVLLCMNFRYYYSGLRNHFSFLLCMIVIYRDFFCRKKDWVNVLLFALAYFIHLGAIIIIVIYYAYNLIYIKIPKKIKRYVNIAIPIFGFLSILLVNFLSIIFPSLLNVAFFSKVYEYIHTSSITNLSYYVLLIIFVIFIFTLVCILKSKYINLEDSDNYITFTFFYILITIGISWNMELLVRFSYLLSFLSISIHMLTIKTIVTSNSRYKKIYYVSMILIIVSQIAFNIIFNLNYPWLFDENIIDLLFIL